MPKASKRIRYPRHRLVRPSGNVGLTGKSVLVSIINSLGDVADLVESLRSQNGTSSIFNRRSSDLDIQKSVLCDAIMDGANSLTAIFDEGAKGANRGPYLRATSAGLPVLRNQIISELQRPLELALAEESSSEPLDLKPFEARLGAIISGVREELTSWLAQFRGRPL